ncbi:DUF1642 domain-containing protein [Paenibacillus cineris]|uniref:Uncharacterized protein n=1 Tax=Paenibacillus cineris TaxID=237530 RepID=A0ABQ4LN69_9BACL|nr:DUF1642 domain-containing protein [Paenibacillus cineris]GIO57968.1 hypothetical protein J21TS7_62860 [Paenibacillus cineris]
MPKVLITNGTIDGTWYEGKEGTVWDVKTTDASVYMLKNGHGRGVAMEDGELLYSQAEYRELGDINEIIQRQRDKAIDDLAKHAQTIVDLQDEKLRLQQEVDRARDKQKVELPREVAEAIEQLKNADLSSFGIMHFIDHISEVKNHQWHQPLRVLRKFTFLDTNQYTGGCELLMNALVNGYTVEPTARDKVKQLIEKWYTDPGDVTDAELYELSDGIIDLLQKSS